MKSPFPLFHAILIYFVVGPPLATLAFLALMGLPPALWGETASILIIVGFGYIVGFVPAMVAAVIARLVAGRSLILRLVLPPFVAAGPAMLLFPAILRGGSDADSDHLRVMLGLAAAIGALVASLVLEWWRGRLARRG